MQKMVLILTISLILIILIIIFKNSNNYDIKISMNFIDLDCKKIDEIYAKNLKDEFLQIKNIKETVIFSKNNICNIYIKLKNKFLKQKTTQEIKLKLDSMLSNGYKPEKIEFDYDYGLKYQIFIVITSDNADKNKLRKNTNNLFNLLVGKKFVNKIVNFQKDEIVNYVYFANSDLVNYNITPSEIKELIKKNNLENNSSLYDSKNSYKIKLNSEINSINDIREIAIYYKNKSFTNKFKNIFKIEETTKNPEDFKILYNNDEAKLIAINKKWYYPNFVIKNKIEKIVNKSKDDIKVEIFYTNYYSKIKNYYNTDISTEELIKNTKEISKNFPNALYFIKTDTPKFEYSDKYTEILNNKIVIFDKKENVIKLSKYLKDDFFNTNKDIQKTYCASNLDEIKKILKENIKEYTRINKTIEFQINNQDMLDYNLDKNEILESIKTNFEGLYCDYYFNDSNKIKIFLKQKNKNNNFIYSKENKALIPYSSFSQNKLESKFDIIVRKNNCFLINK